MALIVETGSGIAGANSYATLERFAAFCDGRGLSLDGKTSPEREAALVRAFDYIETFVYRGRKTSETQETQWPRADVYLDGASYPVDSALIPSGILNAQCQLAYEAVNGVDLQPTGTGQEVQSEKVASIETSYYRSGSGSVRPEFNKANAFLRPYLQSARFTLRTVRL